jgi:hypothetical protein
MSPPSSLPPSPPRLFTTLCLFAKTQNEVEDELADLLGADEEEEVEEEDDTRNNNKKQKTKSNFISADKSRPSKLPAGSRGSSLTGDDYIEIGNEDEDSNNDNNKLETMLKEESGRVDILSMFRNLNIGPSESEYTKPKSIGGAQKQGKNLYSESKLKDEIISPYKNNWILLVLITMFSLVFFGYLFPEELFQTPSIPIPDL